MRVAALDLARLQLERRYRDMAGGYSVRGSLAWMTASQAGSFIIQFASSLVIARLLTPYDMGVFAVAASIVGLLAILRQLGLAGYIVRAASDDPAMLASVFTVNAILAAAISAIIVGFSLVGGALLHEPGVRTLLLAMALNPLLNIFEFLPAAGLEREGNFHAIAVLSLLRGVLSNGVMIAFAFAGYSYMSLAYGQIVSSAVAAVGVSIVGKRYVSFRVGFSNWKDILTYGSQVLAISGVNVAATRVGELLLARFLGLSALGFYSRASGLNAMVWDSVHLVITRVIFVEFSKQRRLGQSLRGSYLKILKMVTALLWPAFAGVAVLAGPLVVTVFGAQWAEAATPLSFIAIGSVVIVSITMTYEVFVVCGELGRQARLEFIRGGMFLVLFGLGSMVSLAGVGLSRLGEALVLVFLYRKHLERMTDTAWSDFLPIYRVSALLTAVAVTPAIIVMACYGWSSATPIGWVLAGVLAGMIAWAIGLRVLRHPLVEEAARVFEHIGLKRYAAMIDPNHEL